MATGRMLKKNISESRRLSELKTDSARMLWTWIIPYLDVEGRFHAAPDMIKGKVVPRLKTFTEENIQEYLNDMNDVGLIQLYEADGDIYLQFRKFDEHQTNLRKDREMPPSIPAPKPENLIKNKRKTLPTGEWSKLWTDFNNSAHICPICKRQGEKRKDRAEEYVINGFIPFEIDHIIPLSSGGTYDLSNLQIVCRTCNRSKGATLVELQSNSGGTPAELRLNIREVNLREAKGTPEQLPVVDNSEKEKDASLKKPVIETEKQELRSLMNQIQVKYPQLPIFKFLQSHNRDHPGAIIHTLKSLLANEIKVPEPVVMMKYLETTITAENMNYNAADEDRKSQEYKRDRKPMESLGNIMSGMLKSMPVVA